MSNRLVQLDVYSIALPLNRSGVSESVLVTALLADGTMGLGQCVPCHSLTGETIESTIYHVSHTFSPLMSHLEPKRFGDLLDFVDQLPFFGEQDQLILNARACVELALLDAYSRHFSCHLSSVIGWLGYAPFVSCGNFKPPAVTAILDEVEPEGLLEQLNGFRRHWFRDFKLMVGYENDDERIRIVVEKVRRKIETAAVSLRVDAQGNWDVDRAIDMAETLDRLGVFALEQPLATDDQSHNRILADLCDIPLIADESLLTLDDGQQLAENDLVDFFNLSVNKNGGLIPTIRLAELAAKTSRGFILGGEVDEPGLLSGAGIQFLQMVPDTLFTEIGYGDKRLQDDVVCPRGGFGFRGKVRTNSAQGLGVELCKSSLEKFSQKEPRKIHLA